MSPRSTRQRDVIARVLARAPGPLTVAEVHAQAGQELGGAGLGIATVYRTLRLLTEQGQIHPVVLGGDTLYEASGRGHHHHFSCSGCGRVFAFSPCPLSLPSGSLYPGGFLVESHEVTLYGRCPECRP